MIARSTLWDLLPPGLHAQDIQADLKNDFGLPEWLVNNFLVGPVYVCGGDFEGFTDAIAVTKMTRLGTLLQRFSGWSDLIEDDYAGGLRLKVIKDAGLYLAVRGRVLAAARDRDALIRALVLPPDAAVGEKAFQQTLANLKDEMVEIRVRPEAWPAASPYVDAAEAHVWLGEGMARAVLACRLTPDTRTQYAPVLENARPVALAGALPGALRLSADLGLPAEKSWSAMASLFGVQLDVPQSVAGMLPEQARESAKAALKMALENAGSSWSLSYRGLNPWAMAPMPKFAALLSCGPSLPGKLLSAFPPPPAGVGAWESWPRKSEDGTYIHIPMPGGVDFEPVIAPYAAKVLVATALPDAQDLLAAPAAPADPSAKGNVLLEAEPAALVNDLLELALQLDQLELIRDMNAESLAAWFAPWQTAAAKVPLARLVAGHDDGVITLDLRLALTQ